jgi:hypothetical protein
MSSGQVLKLLVQISQTMWPLKIYMVVNFRAYKVNRIACKLIRTLILIKKNKKRYALTLMDNIIPHRRHARVR